MYGVWYEVVRRKGKTAKAIRLTAAVSVCLWERYPRAHQQHNLGSCWQWTSLRRLQLQSTHCLPLEKCSLPVYCRTVYTWHTYTQSRGREWAEGRRVAWPTTTTTTIDHESSVAVRSHLANSFCLVGVLKTDVLVTRLLLEAKESPGETVWSVGRTLQVTTTKLSLMVI